MSEDKIKFAETVVLIDAAFLNFVVTDMKRHFESSLQRPLQDIDVRLLTSYIMLDTGITQGEHTTQFVFVYDKASSVLAHHIEPSDLKTDLSGVAFDNLFGEFAFDSVPTEGMVTREELYLDLLALIIESADVKKLVVISFNEEYGDKVSAALSKVKDKEVIQFRMYEPEETVAYRWEMLPFPIMQALGIKSEEL